MRSARSTVLNGAAGAAVSALSFLSWAAAGLALRTAALSIPLLRVARQPQGFELFTVLLSLAASIGFAAGALKGHVLRIPLRLLGRLVNVQAFLLLSGLPVLKTGFQSLQVELDLTPFALILAVAHAASQTLIDVYELHAKG